MVMLTAVLLAGCAGSLGSSDALSSSQELGSAETAPQQKAGARSDPHVTLVADKSTSPATTDAYRIGPMDVLDISVFNVPDLSKTVQVAETGTINLPLVGEIPAAGKTTRQLERDLTAKLGAKYLQNPQVTVMLKENNSHKVTVEGAVKTPGVYPMKGATTLLQVMAMAGGLDPNSDSTVLVLRNSGGKRSAGKFDISAIQNGSAEDPTVQSGDVVVAGTSAIKAGFNNILKVVPLAGLVPLL